MAADREKQIGTLLRSTASIAGGSDCRSTRPLAPLPFLCDYCYMNVTIHDHHILVRSR
jgi:hypothetical protein